MRPQPNKKCPALSFPVLGVPESTWDIAKAEPEHFSLLIFYRGLHCPICKSYLKAFNDKVDELGELGVELAALSMDDEDKAKKARKEWGLDKLPIGYGMSEETARRWGLYISEAIKDEEPARFSEPGLFLVGTDQTIHYIAINSMPFGRPDPDDVVSAVEFILEKSYPPRGSVAA